MLNLYTSSTNLIEPLDMQHTWLSSIGLQLQQATQCATSVVITTRLTLKGGLGMGRDPSAAYMLCRMHGYRRRSVLR